MYQSTNQRDFARHLRTKMTDAERALWQHLRGRHFAGLKFRRQAAIDRYIVDFICFDIQLVIELDGGQHAEESQAAHDAVRTSFLESQGFTVIRFWNCDVLEDVDAVLGAIEKAVGMLIGDSPPSPSPSPRVGGE